MAKKQQPAKRAPRGKYEQKLVLADGVEFDDLFKVAINHKQPKKTPAKKK